MQYVNFIIALAPLRGWGQRYARLYSFRPSSDSDEVAYTDTTRCCNYVSSQALGAKSRSTLYVEHSVLVCYLEAQALAALGS